MKRIWIFVFFLASSHSFAAVTCGDIVTATYNNNIDKAVKILLESTVDIRNKSLGQKYFSKIYKSTHRSKHDIQKVISKTVKVCMEGNPDDLLSNIVMEVL